VPGVIYIYIYCILRQGFEYYHVCLELVRVRDHFLSHVSHSPVPVHSPIPLFHSPVPVSFSSPLSHFRSHSPVPVPSPQSTIVLQILLTLRFMQHPLSKRNLLERSGSQYSSALFFWAKGTKDDMTGRKFRGSSITK
jgi:hypothetical protein